MRVSRPRCSTGNSAHSKNESASSRFEEFPRALSYGVLKRVPVFLELLGERPRQFAVLLASLRSLMSLTPNALCVILAANASAVYARRMRNTSTSALTPRSTWTVTS